MIGFSNKTKGKSPSAQAGFTLIEVMVAIAVSAIAVTAMVSTFNELHKNSIRQVDANILQQNQRGVLSIMGKELRHVGMSRRKSRSTAEFRITDIRHFNITEPGTDAQNTIGILPESHPILQVQVDFDDDGVLGANETITYMLYDRDGDPNNGFDLGRTTTAFAKDDFIRDRQLVAEGIEEIQYAFAFDADGDGLIDRRPLPEDPDTPVIEWGVDTDNDGMLDRDLDLDIALKRLVAPEEIRVIRVWMLVRGKKNDPDYRDTHGENGNPHYGMGRRAIPYSLPPSVPFGRNYRRWLLSEIIHLRNGAR